MTAQAARGWCEPELQRELPGLAVVSIEAELAAGRSPLAPSPQTVIERLWELSNRWRGARAVAVRQEPVPAAYRVLFRQIGLDPDVTRTPIEQAMLVRMLEGGLSSRGLLSDVLTLALADLAIPVWALDAETVDGLLGLRLSRAGEQLLRGAQGTALPGRLVVADTHAPVAMLFAEPCQRCRPKRSTRKLLLYAVQAPGVPSLYVEETLWACRTSLLEA